MHIGSLPYFVLTKEFPCSALGWKFPVTRECGFSRVSLGNNFGCWGQDVPSRAMELWEAKHTAYHQLIEGHEIARESPLPDPLSQDYSIPLQNTDGFG